MKPGLAKIFVISVALTLGGVAAFLAGKNRLYAALGKSPLRFPYKSSVLSREIERPLEDLGFHFTTRDFSGAKLTTLDRQGTTSRCLLLFFPGNDEHPLRSATKFLHAIDPERRCSASSFAYRGYDSSEGVPDASALENDTLVFVERALTERPRATEIHGLGFSLGTILAAKAAEKAHALGRSLSSLVLLAPARSLSMLPPGPLSRLHPGDQYRFPPLAPDVSARILLLQGIDDEAFGGPGEARALRATLGAAFGPRLVYEEYDGLGHGALLDSPFSGKRVRAFVSTTLPSAFDSTAP